MNLVILPYRVNADEYSGRVEVSKQDFTIAQSFDKAHEYFSRSKDDHCRQTFFHEFEFTSTFSTVALSHQSVNITRLMILSIHSSHVQDIQVLISASAIKFPQNDLPPHANNSTVSAQNFFSFSTRKRSNMIRQTYQTVHIRKAPFF